MIPDFDPFWRFSSILNLLAEIKAISVPENRADKIKKKIIAKARDICLKSTLVIKKMGWVYSRHTINNADKKWSLIFLKNDSKNESILVNDQVLWGN